MTKKIDIHITRFYNLNIPEAWIEVSDRKTFDSFIITIKKDGVDIEFSSDSGSRSYFFFNDFELLDTIALLRKEMSELA